MCIRMAVAVEEANVVGELDKTMDVDVSTIPLTTQSSKWNV